MKEKKTNTSKKTDFFNKSNSRDSNYDELAFANEFKTFFFHNWKNSSQ